MSKERIVVHPPEELGNAEKYKEHLRQAGLDKENPMSDAHTDARIAAELQRRTWLPKIYGWSIIAAYCLFGGMIIFIVVVMWLLLSVGLSPSTEDLPSIWFFLNHPRYLIFFSLTIFALCVPASTILIVLIRSISRPYDVNVGDKEYEITDCVPAINMLKELIELISSIKK